MKVFVSTSEGQGVRDNDFCFCLEGELVIWGPGWQSICPGEKIDGPCGCKRSLIGIEGGGSTTTFRTEDLNITHGQLVFRIMGWLQKSKWVEALQDPEDWANFEATEITRMAAKFSQDLVLERRGKNGVMVKPRTIPAYMRKKEGEVV